jgi:methenyltetrahydrofolate cyclohydrolase
MTDLADFLEELSSAQPVPGGGSVAALECALGASLLVMVSNLTLGRKKYADVETRVLEIRGEAERLRERATQLSDEDVLAYGRVAGVLAMPRETDAQKVERRESMQAALKGAVEPPLATMATAGGVLDLAADLMRIGNRSAISDVGTAAGAARAGFDAALLNVEINLASISDAQWVESIRVRLDSFSPVADRADAIAEYVLAAIRSSVK